MSRPLKVGLLIAAAALIAVIVATDHYANLPQRLSQHETVVLGDHQFAPGTQAALRVIVRDSHNAEPLSEAAINVSLQSPDNQPPLPLYSGVTDRSGTADVSFRVPEDAAPDQTLIVETQSRLGSDRLEQAIQIERDYRVLLVTDKPIYQPGQIIHVRALALRVIDRQPAANQSIEMTIADGKGNTVFRKTIDTSDYGVTATDFQLANEVNTGPYKITALLGSTSSEKTVTVEHYVLPKFEIKLSTDRSYYQPGQRVRGTLSANYFFGKPVSSASVTLEGYTFDVERTLTFDLQGTTDADGQFEFELDLPKYIAGSDLDTGLGRYYLQANVIDLAQHGETSNRSLAVSANPIVIRAIPEGGRFRSGVENILYVLTSTPDGAPIETNLMIAFHNPDQSITAHTDRYGLAEARFTPKDLQLSLTIQAQAANGADTSREFKFEGDRSARDILLRPDRPIYRVGEAMTLTFLTAQSSGSVYLDIVRDGQTVSTRAVPVNAGRAEAVVDLTPDLGGTLELHAYQLLSDGSIIRDTRLVIVDDVTDLNIALKPDRDVYRPGDRAALDIAVTGADGSGAQSAIGLAIVDESVFALAEQDPGFAKLYFLLEKELLEPKYDLHGFSLSRSVTDRAADPIAREAQTEAARASLAQAAPQNVSFGLAVNSHEVNVQRAIKMSYGYFAGLGKWLSLLSIALALAIVVQSGRALHQRKRLGVSFLIVLFTGIGLFVLARSGQFELAQIMLIPLGLSLPIGLLMLIGLAARRKDRLLRWAVGLMVMYIVLLVAIFFTEMRAGFGFMFDIEWFALFGIALVVLTFFMLLVGEVSGGCGTTAVSLLLIVALLLTGCAPAMPYAPTPPPQPTEASIERVSDTTGATGAQPRLRQYFPETLLWLPDAVTDQNGQLHVDVPIADSITTWRMTALASTRDGRLGSTTGGLRVFQDFFIDLDLPAALTVDDEVSIPVGVFNYLPDQQTVRLEVAPADWFELLDGPVKEMTIAANDVNVAYFRIRAKAFGAMPFKVTAYGTQLSDAIQKMVRVLPNGKQFFVTQSDRLMPDATINRTVTIPAQAITGTQAVTVKIYPGVLSQIVEGLDSILRMPSGCFEQTSSTTYPDVLVLDYLRSTKQAAPEVQLKAEQYVNIGYQRLTTFEVDGGGFSLFGRPPADRMLTAYGLQEFGDMRRVHDVDPAMIKRTTEWLFTQQQPDGSWANDRGLHHESAWQNLKNDRLPVTAYIVWGLIESGFGSDPHTRQGLAYVRDHRGDATDAYVLALVANALVAADRAANAETPDPLTPAVLNQLAGMAVLDKDAAMWKSDIATFMGGTGRPGSIETTALAAYAFLRANDHPQLANAALTTIAQQKDSFGTWYSTQATVLALKALIQSVKSGSENIHATVTVKLDGGQARTVKVTRENFDVMQLITFSDLPAGRDHTIEISTTGEGNLMYQIAGSYYLPWPAVPRTGEQTGPVTIGVKYDRAQLSVNDRVRVDVTVSLNQKNARAESALIDLGVPPGFTVQAADLEALVAADKDRPTDYRGAMIERYELTDRQVLIYLSNLSGDQPLRFSYHLKAKFPLIVQTPSSTAYDYYNPDVVGEAAPQRLTVK